MESDWTRRYLIPTESPDNGVESVNRNLKRGQLEGIAAPDKRAVRGNPFTYLVVVLATVVENLRQIISFFKCQLAVVTFKAKNHKLPRTYWQSERATPTDQGALAPPDYVRDALLNKLPP